MSGGEGTPSGHEPDPLHTANLSTGEGVGRGRPRRGAAHPPAAAAVNERAPALAGRASPAALARLPCTPPTALMMALMIVWATLGHRFANSTRFAGEGSAACLLGLVVGAVLLVARHLFHPEVLQSMLSFDAANFFV